jgi:hypothetical protein
MRKGRRGNTNFFSKQITTIRLAGVPHARSRSRSRKNHLHASHFYFRVFLSIALSPVFTFYAVCERTLFSTKHDRIKIPIINCPYRHTDHSSTMATASRSSGGVATATVAATDLAAVAQQQQKAEMIADEDPLLISQSLTYVTDDGGTLHSFQSAPFSHGTHV